MRRRGLWPKRHAECNVVTVAIDNMYFKAGATQGRYHLSERVSDLCGPLLQEVRIDTYAGEAGRTRKMINRRYFVMVGTDENQNPIEVPGLIVEGLTQEIEWETGKERQQLRRGAAEGRLLIRIRRGSMLPLRNPSRSSVT